MHLGASKVSQIEVKVFFTFLLPLLVLLFLELLGASLVKSLNLCDLHHLQSARGCGDSPGDQIRKHFL